MFYLHSGFTQIMVIVNIISSLHLEVSESTGGCHKHLNFWTSFLSFVWFPSLPSVNVSVPQIADTATRTTANMVDFFSWGWDIRKGSWECRAVAFLSQGICAAFVRITFWMSKPDTNFSNGNWTKLVNKYIGWNWGKQLNTYLQYIKCM